MTGYQTAGTASERAALGQGRGRDADFEAFLRAYPLAPKESQVPYIRRAWDAVPASERCRWHERLNDDIERWSQEDQRHMPSAEKWLIKWRAEPGAFQPEPPEGWQNDIFWRSLRRTAVECLHYGPDEIEDYMLLCWLEMESMKRQNLSEGRRRSI